MRAMIVLLMLGLGACQGVAADPQPTKQKPCDLTHVCEVLEKWAGSTVNNEAVRGAYVELCGN